MAFDLRVLTRRRTRVLIIFTGGGFRCVFVRGLFILLIASFVLVLGGCSYRSNAVKDIVIGIIPFFDSLSALVSPSYVSAVYLACTDPEPGPLALYALPMYAQ